MNEIRELIYAILLRLERAAEASASERTSPAFIAMKQDIDLWLRKLECIPPSRFEGLSQAEVDELHALIARMNEASARV